MDGHHNDIDVLKGAVDVSNLNQIELQNLRHLIGAHETAYQKMQSYAEQAQDPQIKTFFQKSAQEAQATKQKLMSFLQ